MNNLEQIFSQNPQSPIFTILASLYYNNRSYQNAARVCQIGLKHDPHNIAGQYILVKLLLLKEQTLPAEKMLKKIIAAQPQHLNALLLLIAVMEKLDRSFQTLLPYIKKSAQFYPSNQTIQEYYKKYCMKRSSGRKTKATNVQKQIKKTSNFVLNPKLATKTLYHLFYSQHKYSEAYNVLVIMQKSNKNKTFVSKETKIIKHKLLKG